MEIAYNLEIQRRVFLNTLPYLYFVCLLHLKEFLIFNILRRCCIYHIIQLISCLYLLYKMPFFLTNWYNRVPFISD